MTRFGFYDIAEIAKKDPMMKINWRTVWCGVYFTRLREILGIAGSVKPLRNDGGSRTSCQNASEISSLSSSFHKNVSKDDEDSYTEIGGVQFFFEILYRYW